MGALTDAEGRFELDGFGPAVVAASTRPLSFPLPEGRYRRTTVGEKVASISNNE